MTPEQWMAAGYALACMEDENSSVSTGRKLLQMRVHAMERSQRFKSWVSRMKGDPPYGFVSHQLK